MKKTKELMMMLIICVMSMTSIILAQPTFCVNAETTSETSLEETLQTMTNNVLPDEATIKKNITEYVPLELFEKIGYFEYVGKEYTIIKNATLAGGHYEYIRSEIILIKVVNITLNHEGEHVDNFYKTKFEIAYNEAYYWNVKTDLILLHELRFEFLNITNVKSEYFLQDHEVYDENEPYVKQGGFIYSARMEIREIENNKENKLYASALNLVLGLFHIDKIDKIITVVDSLSLIYDVADTIVNNAGASGNWFEYPDTKEGQLNYNLPNQGGKADQLIKSVKLACEDASNINLLGLGFDKRNIESTIRFKGDDSYLYNKISFDVTTSTGRVLSTINIDNFVDKAKENKNVRTLELNNYSLENDKLISTGNKINVIDPIYKKRGVYNFKPSVSGYYEIKGKGNAELVNNLRINGESFNTNSVYLEGGKTYIFTSVSVDKRICFTIQPAMANLCDNKLYKNWNLYEYNPTETNIDVFNLNIASATSGVQMFLLDNDFNVVNNSNFNQNNIKLNYIFKENQKYYLAINNTTNQIKDVLLTQSPTQVLN